MANQKVDRYDVGGGGGGLVPFEDAIPLRLPSWTVPEIDQVVADRSRSLGWDGIGLAASGGSDVDGSGMCSCERAAEMVADAQQLYCVYVV